ncbi:hypothetical protein BST81_13245 [Leptolyngbya sp. 'hensonii']|uniref:hypothetical protein n=1 Tax=Leptolyngbya sp. 'hensonii' TaxID=1922337 RepID=UPI00094FB911|nr:hypothetical protein [Leptolyngbya sp. 'hensonii']OLP18001.1 hypothetical protein BST81_13245 [Leptolyngbya sp. 'hensonii']
MRVGSRSLLGSLLLTVSVLAVTSSANAQQLDRTGSRQVRFETVPDAVDRIMTGKSRNYFENRTLERQTDFLFGFGTLVDGTFAENELATDGKLFEILYRDLMNQQVSTTPIIRTPDLNNPFNSSLLTGTNINNRIMTSELVYERLPMR